MFPYFRISEGDALIALAVAMVVAAVSSALPAYNAGKLNVIDALRRVG
jgi:ABC-type antimicrobial peptide transport system permease subunit